MKKGSLLFILFSLTITCFAQSSLQSFPLSSVQLAKSPFYDAQQTDLTYILALDSDRLLTPFLKEAGIDAEKKNYGNWENTGLDGHIGGHYLSALANMYASTGNGEVKRKLTYMIDWLDSCQRKNGNGYISGVPNGKPVWKEISEGKINANNFSLNNRWVPLYNIHKLFAGLRDAYSIAGNRKAKEMLIKLSDWFMSLTAGLSEEQIQRMLVSEHGGLNEIYADVAAITGDNKYLEAAKRLSHKTTLLPLLEGKDSLTGLHANMQIPKVVGYKRVAELSGDATWARAADFFWNTVVHNRSVSIGGNSVREHFHPASNFSSMINDVQGPETCNTYNMLRLTTKLFLTNPKSSYLDYYERALYNHILSSQHPKGGFVYFTPMRPQHYRVYSQPQESFWCCVGSGIENHGKYGELIYSHDNKDLFVNLFIASKLDWKERGISLLQQTSFPAEQSSRIKLTLSKPLTFGLHIRYPSWVQQGAIQVLVNGKKWPTGVDTSGFVVVDRAWKSGDVVVVQLPMQVKTEYLPDGSPWASFAYGPVVLGAITDTANLTGIRADDSRMGHVANGKLYPINTAPFIVTSKKEPALQVKPIKGKPLSFTASSLIYPSSFQHLVLQPFYTIHDARYMIYWRVTDESGLKKIQDELQESEKKKLSLEEQTVDQVAPGEQQPEVEHNFKGERTEAGIFNDWHWRNATGWFSYELKNKNKTGKKLLVTYYGTDRNVNFDVLANGVLLKKESLDGSKGNALFDVEYELPDSVLHTTDGKIEVKFAAAERSRTARVFYVRLIK
jgi:uncharacterized protein